MIIAIIILLLVSFFFSGSETALTAANTMKLQTAAQHEDKKAQKLVRLLSQPSDFITSILVGKYVSNIIVITLVTLCVIQTGANVILSTILTMLGIIILTEVIPKSIAAIFPDRIARLIYVPIKIWVTLLKPVTLVLNAITEVLNRLLSRGQVKEQRYSKEEIRRLVAIAGSEGAFNEMEHNRLQGVMDFSGLKITDVNTTPRINVTAFSNDVSYDEAYDTVVSNPYTRYPVYEGDIDNIVGVFHSKYLLAWSREQENSIMHYTSKPLFINEHNRAEWALRKMTVTRKHLAIVLDEYGGTEGIVSHEDLIEEMLGMEIEDEMDEEEEQTLEKNVKSYRRQRSQDKSV